MAFLVVGAATVTVKPGGARLNTHEVGDRHRAFDGTYRSTVVDTLRSWSVKKSYRPRGSGKSRSSNSRSSEESSGGSR